MFLHDICQAVERCAFGCEQQGGVARRYGDGGRVSSSEEARVMTVGMWRQGRVDPYNIICIYIYIYMYIYIYVCMYIGTCSSTTGSPPGWARPTTTAGYVPPSHAKPSGDGERARACERGREGEKRREGRESSERERRMPAPKRAPANGRDPARHTQSRPARAVPEEGGLLVNA
jgi:hypothetical protein